MDQEIQSSCSLVQRFGKQMGWKLFSRRVGRVLLCAVVLGLVGVASVQADQAPPTFLLKWGSFNDDGRLHKPNGVAVDNAGNVFVTDDTGTGTSNARIQKFGSTFMPTVSRVRTGNGSVSGTGIICTITVSSTSGDHITAMPEGTTVTLTSRSAGADSQFVGLSNCDASLSNQCTLTLTANKVTPPPSMR